MSTSVFSLFIGLYTSKTLTTPSTFSALKRRYSSIAFLLFLLGPIVGSTCLAALAAGWFPEWPGIDNLPYSLLFGPGFWTIPGYWI